MQPEQFIRELTDLAETKNRKEAFLTDRTQGGNFPSARVNMGRLPGPTWRKRGEYRKMMEDLDEYKKGTCPRKIKECLDWAKKKGCALPADVTRATRPGKAENYRTTNGLG